MKTFEKMSVWIRHLPLLEHAEWLWNPVRPIYQRAVSHFGENGLERLINGSDRILVSPRARDVSEKYELDVWRALMAELRIGDTFVDVGAYIGLYTIAVGLRLRGSGRIVAFEPDNHNFSLLQQHVKLNGLEKQIELHRCAVSDKDGQYCFSAECSALSRLVSPGANYATMIQVVALDSAFPGERIDILKIDVEGYEEMVLRGAYDLLRSRARRPRAVFVEVHPYAWPSLGTTSASLLSLLSASGYHAETPSGEPVRNIEQHGEIVARVMR
jgi:FkbM family methyltransferase